LLVTQDSALLTRAHAPPTKLFGYLQYYTAQQQALSYGTNEARACQIGCAQCFAQLNDNTSPPYLCAMGCKLYDYTMGDSISSTPIIKGVIEPDKACIMGCEIALCQGVCTGPVNFKKGSKLPQLPPKGGCQIFSAAKVQNYKLISSNFNPYCCNQLQNLCSYCALRASTV